MARTDITLRADKGSALTFDEMDVNFSSFFYSASALTVDGANKLRLHYTGSSELASPFNTSDYIEVLLPTAESSEVNVSVPGSDRQVIFNSSNSFGASSAFIFTQDTGEGPRLGVGSNPSQTLDITSTYTGEPTIFNLNASSTTSNQNAKAFIQFRQGGSTFAQLGKRNTGNNDIDFFVKNKLNLGINDFGSPEASSKKLNISTTGVSIGNGIDAAALSELSVEGDITIGSALQVADSSYIGPSNVSGNLLPSNATTTGLLIQSPKGTNGGNVIIGINTDSNRDESFSVVKGIAGSYSSEISPIATFKADGKIGFNQRNPKEILHVEGNITGSGNIQIEGSATVKTISELASLTTDWVGSNTEYAQTLVKSSTGLVQYMDAAPVPKGGIIMWSGAVDNVPKGWRLCDGSPEENGIPIPDLRNKFIVAANNTTGTATTNIEGTNKTIGGSNTHNHGGNTGNTTLSLDQIPSHDHVDDSFCSGAAKHLGMAYCSNNQFSGVGDTDAEGGDHGVGSNTPELIIHFNTISCLNKTNIKAEGGGESHNHSISSANNIPNYYALAFIIYVGVA